MASTTKHRPDAFTHYSYSGYARCRIAAVTGCKISHKKCKTAHRFAKSGKSYNFVVKKNPVTEYQPNPTIYIKQ